MNLWLCNLSSPHTVMWWKQASSSLFIPPPPCWIGDSLCGCGFTVDESRSHQQSVTDSAERSISWTRRNHIGLISTSAIQKMHHQIQNMHQETRILLWQLSCKSAHAFCNLDPYMQASISQSNDDLALPGVCPTQPWAVRLAYHSALFVPHE